ncbi:MAG TPA: ABC transporter permease [Mycobacteriales bacterium]|nr:ABC transporter permease [Mycobacteriales bacterium]
MIDWELFRFALLAEWTKIRSVRSTYWTILVAIALGVGLSAAIAAGSGSSYDELNLHDQVIFDPTALSLAGLFFAQLALGVFAIVTMSAEYSSGTIRTTFSAIPHRGVVLAAKAVATGGIALVVGCATAFGAFFLGQLIFSHYHLSSSIGSPGALRAVFGGGLYIAGLVLLALGLAAIIRHTAGAITALVAIVFIVPFVSQLLPESLQHNVARYLPANAGGSITTVVHTPEMLGPWTGYAVFLAWTALILGVGWFVLRTRDV